MTITMYENGNTFQVKLQKVTATDPGEKYIKVDGEAYELISKVRTSSETVTEEMSEVVKPEGDVFLKPISKRRILKLFRRYSTHANHEIHKHNIEQQQILMRTMTFANIGSAGLPAKESRQLVDNGIKAMQEIIKGRFSDPDGRNTDAEFFQQWTERCRGEGWFKYLQENRG